MAWLPSYTSVKMNNMFSISGSSRFFSLHIAKRISVITYKNGLVAITPIRFGLIALFKVARTFNFEVEIGISLATSLTYKTDLVSDFDHLTLAVGSIFVMSMFLLASL